MKPLAKQAAFTFIELIVTLLIIGIVAAYAQSKFISTSSFKENAVIAELISSARLTQQLSMNDSDRNFSLVIQSNQLDVQADGISMSVGNINYPIVVDNAVSLSPASTILFTKKGASNNLVISVTGEITQQVCFETSGYVHLC